ncbi:translation initiation factor IF-2 [Streptomyces coffeae]|uniref:Translation initiation factor IF-2 n=1 Tax=Streptomyces coffeae TaxID=621382 RepID=A0ABS1NAJ9_9ACTN|nr:translation initiation factor IF-2 [Streptomyces coffeae]MBL1097099.1 translation initiation factor IF-2 [Streptomyces coffeae]
MSTPTAGIRGRLLGPWPGGTVWLVRRQHRSAFRAGAALVAAAIAYIVWRRWELTSFIDAHAFPACPKGVAGCMGGTPATPRGVEGTAQGYGGLGDAVVRAGQALLALPALIGVFAGAPLFARELESGTHKLVWAQSVGRVRWLLVKLLLPAASVTAGTAGVAAAYHWWWAPAQTFSRKLGDYQTNPYVVSWWQAAPFNATGPLAVGLAVLGLVIGATAGLLLRRTVPAMAVALGVVVAAQWGATALRGHLASSVVVTKREDGVWPVPRDTWWGSESRTDGRPGTRDWAEIHPPSDFWRIQWIEAGICLVLAAALAVFCVWWIRRRPV